jgi:hypothetical protein
MVLVVFAVLAIIGQVLNVFLCLALDQIFSPAIGALGFVLLYILVFAGAWLLSIRIVERWQGQPADKPTADKPQTQPQTRRPVLQTSMR